MIDSRVENVFPLTEAASQVPGRAGGKPANIGTLHRWASVGTRGVKLETLWIGGVRYTSREAMERFFVAVTEARNAQVLQPSA